MKRFLTLLAALSLGPAIARADGNAPASGMADILISERTSHRGVAEDYLVMPSGGELSAQMRFVTADAMPGAGALQLTDLALFGVSARYSLLSRLEVGASVELLPKQPATSDEKAWQSVTGTLRSPLGRRVALQLTGSGGHLLGHSGKWTQTSLAVEWKKTIHPELLAFDVQAGVNALGLDAPGTDASAFLGEVGMQTSALFREPSGHWGGWVGLGYAYPVQYSGSDPTSGMAIDPQPRVSFRAGSVLSLVKAWDLYVDVAVIDRGDLAAPGTTLPILDGGFDQTQIKFGVTRHIEGRSRPASTDFDSAIQVGSL